MIPMMNIIAWSHRAPWPEMRQVEQDLIISRAIVAIFSDDHLRKRLRFRGGTALNKLHFPQPFRYSEDMISFAPSPAPLARSLTAYAMFWSPGLAERTSTKAQLRRSCASRFQRKMQPRLRQYASNLKSTPRRRRPTTRLVAYPFASRIPGSLVRQKS